MTITKRWMRLWLSVVAGFIVAACDAGPHAEPDTQISGRGSGKDNWWNNLPRAGWQPFERRSLKQTWFEVYTVAEGVLAIYEPGQFEEVISYLIIGDERALLFDTGLGIGNLRALIDELYNGELIVLNSHSHYDHIGGNHGFTEISGPDILYARNRQQGLPHEDVREFVGPGWIWKPTPDGFLIDEYAIKPYAVSRDIADGEQIDLGGRVLEVLFTPGHSPDSLSLLDRSGRLLFTGDTFYPASLYTHIAGSDFDDYLASAERLSRLSADVDLILPGHNEPYSDTDVLLRMASAFQEIKDGRKPDSEADGYFEHDFDGFSVVVAGRETDD